jgi:5-methylcytosine-specific restriction endonuclease McrA
VLSRDVQWSVFKRDRFKCRHCQSRNNLHPHHVIFKSHSGEDKLNNLITLCACCHMEGIHGSKLELQVVSVLENDLVVKFIRKGTWIPR